MFQWLRELFSPKKDLSGSLTKIEPNWPSDPRYAAALESLLARLDQGPTRTKRLEQCLAKTGAGLVAPLAAQLASSSRSIREAVCRVLGAIGPASLPAVEMLQRIAGADENRGVREAASDARRKICLVAEAVCRMEDA